MKATKVLCPRCGASFLLPQKSTTATVNVIGKDSQLGTIYLTIDNEKKTKAQERIEKMREAGIDTSKFFAINDTNGKETQVGTIINGSIRILPDDDVVIRSIMNDGTLLGTHLFKQHVLAKMLKMLTRYNRDGIARCYNGDYDLYYYTENLKWLGYDYQWDMLIKELYRQAKMHEHGDIKSFTEANRWYNKSLVLSMMTDYLDQLRSILDTLKVKRHKGRKYVCLSGADSLPNKESSHYYLYCDEKERLISYYLDFVCAVESAKTPLELYHATKAFYDAMTPLRVIPSHHRRNTILHKITQCNDWVDAYKGYGAFFSMQNLILFHGCTFEGKDKNQSIEYLDDISNNRGYWLLGALRNMLLKNSFDIEGKRKEWRQKKLQKLH